MGQTRRSSRRGAQDRRVVPLEVRSRPRCPLRRVLPFGKIRETDFWTVVQQHVRLVAFENV